MNNKRLTSFLAFLAFVCVVASCKSLPDAETLPADPAKATPAVATPRGMLDNKQAAQLLR